MKKSKGELPVVRRFKLMHFLLVIAALYLLFICFKFPEFFEIATLLTGDDSFLLSDNSPLARDANDVESVKPLLSSIYIDTFHRRLENNEMHNAPLSTLKEALEEENSELLPKNPLDHSLTIEILKDKNKTGTRNLSVLDKMADEAWTLGLKAWKEVDKYNEKVNGSSSILEAKPEPCPSWISMNGEDFYKGDGVVFLPCGLAAGSSISVVGMPHFAHHEYVRKSGRKKKGNSSVLVSQFTIELQGLKSVVGEDPPKILHVNPRLRGDWNHKPVIEHNTCYRMQWGTSQRCDGSPSKNDDEMLVDGLPKCEKWMKNDIVDLKESRTTSWFNRFIGRAQKPEVTWSYPFVEGKLFVLTVRAGVDGYHIVVGGRHVTSFSYRTGFSLEDATGLVIKGDVDVHSVFATSLPITHPSFSPERVLEMSADWKSHPMPTTPIRLFIGILSATNHFAERMAVRKTWMQSSAIRSSDVVARFFVALNPRKEVNRVLKEEAAYFGDIVIVPFMDYYELVVLKTIAICEYGVRNASAPYIMKCDDDTFIRVDTVLKELESVSSRGSLYMGNLNRFHRPLRNGKWAVSYEEWPESIYPPYANGPGYIISSDIAKYIFSQHANRRLRLFKMEDVSMGLWVEQFNRSTRPVQYAHNWKFCQYGCMENYFTAHYQSPRQMICLWENLARGQARCCNF